ncbi:unnamed protein product, partial [Closterium sp. NIES-54]
MFVSIVMFHDSESDGIADPLVMFHDSESDGIADPLVMFHDSESDGIADPLRIMARIHARHAPSSRLPISLAAFLVATMLCDWPCDLSRKTASTVVSALEGAAGMEHAMSLYRAWADAYGLSPDSLLPPSPLSLPPSLPPAPHLEDCAVLTALRQQAEQRGEKGEPPAWADPPRSSQNGCCHPRDTWDTELSPSDPPSSSSSCNCPPQPPW